MRFALALFVTSLIFSTTGFAEPYCSPTGLVDDQNLVHSLGSGIVTYSGYDPQTKKTIRVSQSGGLVVSYGNLGQIFVEIGQKIKATDVIARLQNQDLLLSMSVNSQPICGAR